MTVVLVRATQKAEVLVALEDGPATSQDIADATGLSRKHCAAYLGALFQAVVLTRKKFEHEGKGRFAYLYELKAAA